MSLLDALAGHATPVNLKQLATETRLHPSTAHRILSVMVDNRLVDRIEPGTYRLGIRLLELGSLVKSRISVRQEALPHMQDLHQELGETVNLSVRHDDEVVYIERTSGNSSMMRVVQIIGARAPLHITAVGKIFLAEDGAEKCAEYARRTGLAALHRQHAHRRRQPRRRSWRRSAARATPSTTRKPRKASPASAPASTTTTAGWSPVFRSPRPRTG